MHSLVTAWVIALALFCCSTLAGMVFVLCYKKIRGDYE